MYWIEPDSSIRKTPAPEFSLPDAAGQLVTRTQFRQQQHLVLVFLPNPEQAEVRALAEALYRERNEFTLANAAVYAVSPSDAALTSLPTLRDDHNVTREHYAALLPPEKRPAAHDAFVMILNRYGVLEFAGLHLFEDATTVDQITSYVWSLEYQCAL